MDNLIGYATMGTDITSSGAAAWAVLKPFALGLIALSLAFKVSRKFGLGR